MSNELIIGFNPTYKQHIAFQILEDKETTELYYGGAAGGGKTFLACAWITINCLRYKGSRWFIGRDSLKSIWQSTFNTLLDLWHKWDIKIGIDVFINQKDSVIKFINGSEIYMLDLHHNPTDPEFDRLGSTEYTGGFLEEVAQISKKAKEIITSRIRYKLDEFNIIPKLLIASNPTKNWIYSDFYLPYKQKQLPTHKKFVQAFVTDNTYISKHYIDNLKKLTGMDKERLLEGNFEYDDSLAKLFNYDNLNNMFSNTYVEKTNDMYISCDVARKGSDLAVIMLWEGFRVEKIFTWETSKITDLKEAIEELRNLFKIPRSNVVVDDDGVGGGLTDELTGVIAFVNNSKALNNENYSNLKSQCYYKLAEHINDNKIYINCPDYIIRQKIIQELEQIEQKDPDKDGKLAVIGKDKIKENIGRSPDFADSMMMRMIFTIKTKYGMAI